METTIWTIATLIFIAAAVYIVCRTDRKPVEPRPDPVPIPDIEKSKPKEKIYKIEVKDDGTDQTAYIQAQIDAVPDGTPEQPNIMRFPRGRLLTEGEKIGYYNKGIIKFIDRHHLIIEGGTFYTKAPSTTYGGDIGKGNYSHRRHFWIENSSHIHFKKTKVEGSNTVPGELIGTTPELTPDFWKGGHDSGAFGNAPAYKSYWEFEHAFATENSSHITFDNVEVNGVFGDGICIGGSHDKGSHHIKVIGGDIQNIGRQAIAVYNATNVLVDNVYARKLRRAFVDLEPYSHNGYANNVEVKKCNVEVMMTFIAAIGNGEVNDIYVHGNKYLTNGHSVICYDSASKTRRKNWRFEDNQRLGGFGSPIADIRFAMTDNVSIKNNINPISRSQSKISASFEDCDNIEVIQNDFVNGQFIQIIGSKGEIKIKNNVPEQTIVEI